MTNAEKVAWKRLAAEGVAIVVSILLAFWIDAWWEDREQRQQPIGNLQALEAEMEFNQREISDSMEFIEGVFRRMDSAFEALADQESETLPDGFLADIGGSITIRISDTTTSAYDVVVSPENLRLIENAALRTSLIESRQRILEIAKGRQGLNDEYFDRLGPFLASLGLTNALGWPELQEQRINTGFLRPLPTSPYAVDPSALRTSEFWFLYEHWRVIYFDYVWVIARAQQHQAQTLELLRSELAALTGTTIRQPGG